MAHGTGTAHHKLHGIVGAGTIIGLFFAIPSALTAASTGSDGLIAWLSTPFRGLGFLAFFTAAIWYCKLEMDEVIMDYLGGETRAFGLLANKAAALIIWAMAAFAVIKLAFLG
jgi:succinate dehydrogenase hydrophobic anchor subunit